MYHKGQFEVDLRRFMPFQRYTGFVLMLSVSLSVYLKSAAVYGVMRTTTDGKVALLLGFKGVRKPWRTPANDILLSDAKAAKNDAKQIVGGKFAGDFIQAVLR